MAVSSPARHNPTTVYGLDRTIWRRFRAWCDWHDLVTADELNRALEQHMRTRPLNSASDEGTGNA